MLRVCNLSYRTRKAIGAAFSVYTVSDNDREVPLYPAPVFSAAFFFTDLEKLSRSCLVIIHAYYYLRRLIISFATVLLEAGQT